jgi:hypothetical protein
MEVKAGDIGLSGGNLFIQKAIRYFIGSQFSHSFTVLDGPYGVLSVLETTDTIVCMSPFHKKDSEANYIEMWRPVYAGNPSDIQEILKHGYEKYSANWYSYLSYLWFMYRWLCRKFKYEPKVMWKWVVNGQTCTELTCAGYVALIFPELFLNKDLNTISPRELREIMIANPDKFIPLGWYKL